MDHTPMQAAARTLASCLLAEAATGLHVASQWLFGRASAVLPGDLPEPCAVDEPLPAVIADAIEANAARFAFDPSDAAAVIRRRQGMRPIRGERT